MGHAYERGRILYRQARYVLAAAEFQKELLEFPASSVAHSMLGMTLLNLKDLDQAAAEVREGIRLGPAIAYGHYAMAYVAMSPHNVVRSRRGVLFKRTTPVELRPRLLAARGHVLEAIRLDPHNAAYFGLLSAIECDLGRWPSCLEIAEKGLAIRPTDQQCAALRIKALHALGRHEEAGLSIELALNHNPESPVAHLQRGWFMLRLRNPATSIEHFTQSMRLDPNQSKAKKGMRHARVAKIFWPYAVGVQWFLWCANGRERVMRGLILVILAISFWIGGQITELVGQVALSIGLVAFAMLSFGPLVDLQSLNNQNTRQNSHWADAIVSLLTLVWCMVLAGFLLYLQSTTAFRRNSWDLPILLLIVPPLPVAMIRALLAKLRGRSKRWIARVIDQD